MLKRLCLMAGFGVALWFASPAVSHADYFNYPCQPPGIGLGVNVNIIVDASGQFCDGPTEINLSHYHCESGGATVNGGAFALEGQGPLSIGGIGGNGIGGSGNGCSYRCPDNAIAPQPNPPNVWQRSYIDVTSVIKRGRAFCVREGHLTPAGPTSVLVSPDEGFPDDPTKPWQQSGGVLPPQVVPPREPSPLPAIAAGGEPLQIPQVPGLPPVPQVPQLPQVPQIPGLPIP